MVKASARVDRYSKSDIIVSPSILSANFAKLGEQVLFCALIFPSFLFVMLCSVHFQVIYQIALEIYADGFVD